MEHSRSLLLAAAMLAVAVSPVLGQEGSTDSLQTSAEPITVSPGVFTIFGGLAMPVGDFAGTSGEGAGGAKSGWTVGADYSLVFNNSLLVIFSMYYVNNPLDEGPVKGVLGSVPGASVSATSYTGLCPMVGLGISARLSESVTFLGFGELGVMFASSPAIDIKASVVSAHQSSGTSTVFALGLGAGLRFSSFDIGVRYLYAEPKYSITATASGPSVPTVTASGTVGQSTSILLVVAGISF